MVHYYQQDSHCRGEFYRELFLDISEQAGGLDMIIETKWRGFACTAAQTIKIHPAAWQQHYVYNPRGGKGGGGGGKVVKNGPK